MRIASRLLILYFLILAFNFAGQNLVPNPDFELVSKIPSEKDPGINCAKHWRTPTFAGSDYYNIAAEKSNGTPKNRFGKQMPHSGNAYGGICIKTNYYEYLSANLTDTLIKGQDYLVEFYVSRAEKSRSKVKEFGVLFTNKIKWSLDQKTITEKPSIDFINSHGYKIKKKWIKLSGVYQAEGTETVIILGHFNYLNPNGHKRFCHYYIDEVSVTPIIHEKDSAISSHKILDENKNNDEIVHQTFSPKTGETITLKNIFFETNKAELLPTSFPELDKLVQYLKQDIHTTIQINGHTDNTGNENKNKILSEARAKAVADYLILNNVDKIRIKYFGYGSAKPITTNDTDEDKQFNRRVEFIITKK